MIGVFPSGTEPHFFVSVGFFSMADLSILAWGSGLLSGDQDVMGKLFVGMGVLGPVLTAFIPWPSIAVVEAFGILIMNVWVALMYRYLHE